MSEPCGDCMKVRPFKCSRHEYHPRGKEPLTPVPTDPETPQTAAWTPAWIALLDCSDETHGDSWAEELAHHRPAIEAEARAARDAEVRALVERLPGRGVDKTVYRAAVLAILSDTPETGS